MVIWSMETKIIKMEVPYFQVPNEIFEIGLKTSELVVYFYLARCANRGSQAFPSYADIAKKCGVSRPTAIAAVKSLQAKGIIEKQKRYSQVRDEFFSNIYVIKHKFDDIITCKEQEQMETETLCHVSK